MRGRGYALPITLVLAALLALLAADALQGAASSSAAATRTRLRQRAFDAAETGLARLLQALDAGGRPTAAQRLSLGNGATVDVELHLDLVETLTEGFSANRMHSEHYSLTSTGRTETRTELRVDAGVTRLVPTT